MVEIPACIALDRVGDMLYVTCRKGDFAVVDASDPSDLEVKTIRRDILDGDGFKVKTFGGRTFVTSGRRIVELDTMVPAVPQVKHLYDRGDGTAAPSYDDFTIDGTRLYALAHASVDVFELDDAMRTTDAPNRAERKSGKYAFRGEIGQTMVDYFVTHADTGHGNGFDLIGSCGWKPI